MFETVADREDDFFENDVVFCQLVINASLFAQLCVEIIGVLHGSYVSQLCVVQNCGLHFDVCLIVANFLSKELTTSG